MKKILLLAAAALSFSAASAQLIPSGGSYAYGDNPYYTTLDTVNNSGTKSYAQPVSRRFETVTLELSHKVISGTTTGVTAKLYGGIIVNGVVEYTLLYTDTMKATSDNYAHTFIGNPYTHYKWDIAGAGTHSSSFRASLLVR